MKPRIPQFIPQRDKKRIKKTLVPAEEWDNKIKDKYRLNEDDKERVSICVTKGAYEGVVFYFNQCQLMKEEDDGQTPIQFSYTVTKKPPKTNTDTQSFINFAGDVLHHLFETQLKAGTLHWETEEEKNERLIKKQQQLERSNVNWEHDDNLKVHVDPKVKSKPAVGMFEAMAEAADIPVTQKASSHWDPKSDTMITHDDETGEQIENESATGQGTKDDSTESDS